MHSALNGCNARRFLLSELRLRHPNDPSDDLHCVLHASSALLHPLIHDSFSPLSCECLPTHRPCHPRFVPRALLLSVLGISGSPVYPLCCGTTTLTVARRVPRCASSAQASQLKAPKSVAKAAKAAKAPHRTARQPPASIPPTLRPGPCQLPPIIFAQSQSTTSIPDLQGLAGSRPPLSSGHPDAITNPKHRSASVPPHTQQQYTAANRYIHNHLPVPPYHLSSPPFPPPFFRFLRPRHVDDTSVAA